jgi:Chaperone of endosialidase
MRVVAVIASIILLGLAPARAANAQSPTGAVVSVPRLVNITGVYQPASGQSAPGGTVVTLTIYAEQTGGAPLWQETQNVTLDSAGRFSLLFGATQPDGIPIAIFAAADERWLGLHFAGVGETERPRTRLTSVPYALRSADADTLGGRPASAYLLAPAGKPAAGGSSHSTSTGHPTTAGGQDAAAPNDVLPGTANYVAKYVDSANVGTSALFENAGFVGLNTTTPQDYLHIRFTNTAGSFTGLAVQNLGNTASSYSGTLFYDQNGALGQFQGFNNVTHEYRINNIASLGSINFMLGGASKFFVSPASVGIGTTSPASTSNLDVSNAVSGSGATNINITQYAANGFGGNLIGKKARGTEGAPSAVLNNDGLLTLSGTGYGATGFAGVSSGVISMRASENWTDTAQGSYMNFATTANGTTGNVNRMTINSNGNVGIGIFGAQANLEVSNANNPAQANAIVLSSSYAANANASLFIGRKARGTLAAPTAVLSGDTLAGFIGQGYGATAFSPGRGGIIIQATQNWTDTAQGTQLNFNTTATGTITPSTKMVVDPFGNVGIGSQNPGASLDVSRVGTDSVISSTAFANGTGAGAFYVAQTARGSAAAPTAVQAGDLLGAFGTAGYGTTGFNDVYAAIAGFAAENFTDAARGSALAFGSTPLGTNDIVIGMGLLPSGNVGIGTPLDVTGIPTATDKLQVFGDARVGNATTNGCLKRFDGNFLVGTCASDRRYKRNITPFGSVLTQLTTLQPVHYYWRTTEFPEKHFGDAQAYGLIAQDVEQVLPELVVTNPDGYKAVDYSKLPLLTIQAVKELKAENDNLKERLAEVERALADLLATTRRQ